MLLALQPAAAQTVDYDADDDRLIEVSNLAQLDAIRHDLNGNGDATHADYIAAFPSRDTTPATRMGCPSGMACNGYELTADLTFPSSGQFSSWTPLGGFWDGIFNGNGHTLTNLNSAAGGLFGELGGTGVVRYLGLVNPTVETTTGSYIGPLAAQTDSASQISATFVRGGTVRTAHSSGTAYVGGIVGRLRGTIRASYASAALSTSGSRSNTRIGGLVGTVENGSVIASYAYGAVSGSGSNVLLGGLLGNANAGASVTSSYCDRTASGRNACLGGGSFIGSVPARTSSELKRPTGYTGDYAGWNQNVDGVSGADDPWDFGTRRDYPLLKADRDGDGTRTWEEFGGQFRYIPPPPAPPPYNPAHDHPEIYQNARHEMTTSCEVRTTGEGDDAQTTSTLTFDLGNYTRPLTLALSLWDGTHFRSLQSQNISMPELRQDGQTATVEVVTDPAQTRFRLDSEYGLNLVLGYADCHTDDP